MVRGLTAALAAAAALTATNANATLVSLGACVGAFACEITTDPPNPVAPNPNDGKLLAWDERQNITLTDDLRVDRVFDPTASFVEALPGGDFLIKAGTVVSSHYLQWDPGNGSDRSVKTTVSLDSQIFAFMTADSNLFDSDDILGLPGLDYNDFSNRGLEGGDVTTFNGTDVDIDWFASSPGDWTRLITAFSPGGEPPAPIPLPATLPMLASVLGLGVFFAGRRRA